MGFSSLARPRATRAHGPARRTFSWWQPSKLVYCARVYRPLWRQTRTIHMARRPVQPRAFGAFSSQVPWDGRSTRPPVAEGRVVHEGSFLASVSRPWGPGHWFGDVGFRYLLKSGARRASRQLGHAAGRPPDSSVVPDADWPSQTPRPSPLRARGTGLLSSGKSAFCSPWGDPGAIPV